MAHRAAALAFAVIAALGAGVPALATGQDETLEVPLPEPRPDFEAEEEAAADQEAEAGEASESEEAEAPEPPADEAPDSIATQMRTYQQACPAVLSGRVVATLATPLSGDGCSLQSPLQVEAVTVNGRSIALPGAPVMSCAMATGLADWAEAADRGADSILGANIEALATGPGYACRLRNNADEGFLSEHGFGNAADIAGLSLSDGRSLSVLEDWDLESTDAGARFLDFVHTDACTRFTTVLGPEANADHEDHLHFDLGCHGSSCTARICE